MLLQGLQTCHATKALQCSQPVTAPVPILKGGKYIFTNEASSFFRLTESVKLTTPYIFSFEVLWYLLSQYALPKLESI